MTANNKYLKQFNFNKKIVFIIGGSGLIGQEVVKFFLSLGAKIINFDQKKSLNKNNKLIYEKFIVEEYECEKYNFKHYVKKYGCPDIFINTSYPRTKDWSQNSFKNVNIHSYKKNINLHLNSYCWISKEIADFMTKFNKKGSVILMNSIYGIRGQNLNFYRNTKMADNMTYSIIKGGITNYIKQLSSFYSSKGIRFNSVVAGGLYGHVAGSANEQNKKFLKRYSEKCPLKRLGYAKEIANVIIFLSSDASSYINGSNLVVDGGMSVII
jgi:NAD(P)-dependent dehydrogenase (short-subunit alcohol dehydrogenase family)